MSIILNTHLIHMMGFRRKRFTVHLHERYINHTKYCVAPLSRDDPIAPSRAPGAGSRRLMEAGRMLRLRRIKVVAGRRRARDSSCNA